MSPDQTAHRLARAFQTLHIIVTATSCDTAIAVPRQELVHAMVQLQRGERTYSTMRAEGVLQRQMRMHPGETILFPGRRRCA